MNRSLSRRNFLVTAAGASLAGLHATRSAAANVQDPQPAPTPAPTPAATPAPAGARRRAARKAVKLYMVQGSMPLAEKFALLKRLGFDGVEPESPSALSRDEVLAAKAASGLEIPGVVDSVHWEKTLGDPDPKVRSAGIDGLLTALDDAKAFGASSVLLVPAVVNKKIAYADAYARSQAALREVLPKAAELGIQIALENVWNNFLLSPLEFARYVDELESPWLRVHFDPGNVVRYGWPEQWVGVLGKRIAKMDVKDFLRAPKKKTDGNGQWSGFSVPLLEGDTDWPAVVAALDAIGYHDEAAGLGWYTAEIEGGDEKWLADVAARMDRILAS